MPGTATVTINENQWNVEVASTIDELTTGLSGRSSMPAGTGMLFILPASQQVTVITQDMLFPIDIIFISSSIVIDVASGIEPGYEVTEETPCDMFLEVNAGEGDLVEVGDIVSTVIAQEPGADWTQLFAIAMTLAGLGFVGAIAYGLLGLEGHSSSSGEVRRLGRPRTEEERAKVHKEFYGTEELPPRGTGLSERGELGERVRRLGEREAKGISSREHHSMWLTPEQRKELEKKYGMVAVRWAEEATKPGDIKAAERAAEYYYGKVKEALGLGHLSPKLSEEQIVKLREILGLSADVAAVLKIHRETGYVP
ncbi:hypothetical protein ES706_05175 [subsurface metagenome]